jgi:hypothetical protein
MMTPKDTLIFNYVGVGFILWCLIGFSLFMYIQHKDNHTITITDILLSILFSSFSAPVLIIMLFDNIKGKK